MSRPDHSFGPFKHDKLRLEAVRLHERRRLVLGLSMQATVIAIGLLTDHPIAIVASLGALLRTLSR